MDKKTRKIKKDILRSYKRSIKNSWYAPKGYIWVTNIDIRNDFGKRFCKGIENPDEYSFYKKVIDEYREKYGDVQVVDICSDSNGHEWRGSEVSKYNFGDVYDTHVAVYVPIRTWLNVPLD